jgi:hypothetical protein
MQYNLKGVLNMATTIKDDRSEEQKQTHKWLIVGTDNFLGRWGRECGAIDRNQTSLAAWACEEGKTNDCQCWVEGRNDMKRVRMVLADTYRPKNAHLHIYVWGADRD